MIAQQKRHCSSPNSIPFLTHTPTVSMWMSLSVPPSLPPSLLCFLCPSNCKCQCHSLLFDLDRAAHIKVHAIEAANQMKSNETCRAHTHPADFTNTLSAPFSLYIPHLLLLLLEHRLQCAIRAKLLNANRLILAKCSCVFDISPSYLMPLPFAKC